MSSVFFDLVGGGIDHLDSVVALDILIDPVARAVVLQLLRSGRHLNRGDDLLCLGVDDPNLFPIIVIGVDHAVLRAVENVVTGPVTAISPVFFSVA